MRKPTSMALAVIMLMTTPYPVWAGAQGTPNDRCEGTDVDELVAESSDEELKRAIRENCTQNGGVCDPSFCDWLVCSWNGEGNCSLAEDNYAPASTVAQVCPGTCPEVGGSSSRGLRRLPEVDVSDRPRRSRVSWGSVLLGALGGGILGWFLGKNRGGKKNNSRPYFPIPRGGGPWNWPGAPGILPPFPGLGGIMPGYHLGSNIGGWAGQQLQGAWSGMQNLYTQYGVGHQIPLDPPPVLNMVPEPTYAPDYSRFSPVNFGAR